MQIKILSLLLAGTSCISLTCLQAATFSVGGATLVSMNNASGSSLTTSSIIQVGYFNGVSSATDPDSYTLADWAAFTPLSGIDSLNDGKTTNVNASLGNGTYDISLNYDTTTDTLPASYAVRLGIRIFDSTTTTTGTNYNTVSSNISNWVLSDPTLVGSLDPDLTIISSGDAGLAWQDGGANAFKTTIIPVPEPSSFALLGLGALALTFRRRK